MEYAWLRGIMEAICSNMGRAESFSSQQDLNSLTALFTMLTRARKMLIRETPFRDISDCREAAIYEPCSQKTPILKS